MRKWIYHQISKVVFPNKGITHIKRPIKLVDIIFEENWLESLYVSYLRYPKCIHGSHAYFYNIKQEFQVLSVSPTFKSGIVDDMVVLGSGAGVLLPPHSLYHRVTEGFEQIAPTNDDLWIWAMAHLAGTMIRLIDNPVHNLVCIDGTQENSLGELVNKNEVVSSQLKNIVDEFPLLLSLFSKNHD